MYPLPFLEARSHLQGHVPSQIPEQNSALPLPAPGVSERVGGGQLQARILRQSEDCHIRCVSHYWDLAFVWQVFCPPTCLPSTRLFLNKVTFGVATGHVFGKVNVGL